MISTPDFRHKQVVFLNTADFSKPQLSFRNENIVVSGTYGTIDKVPLHRLLAVFIAGETTLTSKLMEKCMANGASLFLLKRNLATYASIGAYAEGNYLLRQKQYALEEEQSIRIAKKIVENKLVNHLALLRSVDCDVVRTRTRLAYKKNNERENPKGKRFGGVERGGRVGIKRFFSGIFFQNQLA